MTSENQPSIGDENTLQGEKTPAEERSLGDRSTYLGSEESSLSDAAGELGLDDHDMEIVDLSKRYRIEKSLGKGGMGEVLLATDTRLDRQVAIKRIRADIAVGKTAAARFLTEAKAVAALNHNNVVSIHDYGRDANGPFLIMEYVSGGSLLQRCKQGPIELEQAIDIACQLCGGLGRAHDAGIIHRDIKPANILLTDDGIPKLTDFGLAKADSRDHTMTMAGAVLGTLDFMPPEQRQDASLTDKRSDLWSLAATLYQMVTGESPKVIRLKRVPEQIRDVLDKALEESKDERFQASLELRDALRDAIDKDARGRGVALENLDEGQCFSCGSRNPSSRKFCKECAASLMVSCLKCKESIPVWEKICGECGCVQEEILEQRRVEMKQLYSEAETRLGGNFVGFEESLREFELKTTEMQNEKDPRLAKCISWSTNQIKRLERESERDDMILITFPPPLRTPSERDAPSPPPVNDDLFDEIVLSEALTSTNVHDGLKPNRHEMQEGTIAFGADKAIDDEVRNSPQKAVENLDKENHNESVFSEVHLGTESGTYDVSSNWPIEVEQYLQSLDDPFVAENGFHLSPLISESKLKAAMELCGLTHKTDVLALFDNTDLGHKNFLLITRNGLAGYNDSTASEQGKWMITCNDWRFAKLYSGLAGKYEIDIHTPAKKLVINCLGGSLSRHDELEFLRELQRIQTGEMFK